MSRHGGREDTLRAAGAFSDWRSPLASSTRSLSSGSRTSKATRPRDEDVKMQATEMEKVEQRFQEIQRLVDEGKGLEEYLVASIDFTSARSSRLGFDLEEVPGVHGGEDCLRVKENEDKQDSILEEYGRPVFATGGICKLNKGDQVSVDTFRGKMTCKVAEAIADGDYLVEVRETSSSRPIGCSGKKEMQDALANAAKDKDKTLQLMLLRKNRYSFMYKQRECKGSAMHVAALHRDGHQLISHLIKLRASVNDECSFSSRGLEGRALPIHLAASVGHDSFPQVLHKLLEHQADIQAKTCLMGLKKSGGKANKFQRTENYTALHEASLYGQCAAVKTLLDCRASVNETSVKGSTPLHVVAKRGIVEVAKILVEEPGVDLRVQDKNKSTPLMDAVDFGQFPHDKLHLLSTKNFDDVITVARLCPPAASAMLRDSKTNKVHKTWSEALELNVEKWIDLMRVAPQAGEDVLEALTEEPKVNDEFNFPLPRRHRLFQDQDFTCHYVPYREWDYVREATATNLKEDVSAGATTIHVVSTGNFSVGDRIKIGQEEAVISSSGVGISTISLKTPLKGLHCSGTVVEQVEGTRSSKWQVKLGALNVDSIASRAEQGLERNVFQRLCGSCRPRAQKVAPGPVSQGQVDEATHGLRGELVPVKIRRLSVPGLLCPGVLEVLRDTRDHHIFVKLQTQALLSYAWCSLVRWHCMFNVLFRIMDIVVLGLWVIAPPIEDSGQEDLNQKRLAWSYLAVSIHRDALYEAVELYQSVLGFEWICGHSDETVIKEPGKYFENWRNYADHAIIWVMLMLVYMTWSDQRLDAYPEVLALLAFSRWSVLAYSFRAWPLTGMKMLPILRSFIPMAGIFLVTAFFFMGFLHAFLALDVVADVKNQHAHIVVSTFRFLLLGDGDGVSTVLGLGGVQGEDGNVVTVCFFVVATFIFCICILNLFIAVHGEAYDAAQEKAFTSFLQERATICLQCFQRPHWPPPPCRRRKQPRRTTIGVRSKNDLYKDPATTAAQFPEKVPYPRWMVFLEAVIVVPIWALIVVYTDWHPSWPAAFFLAFVILGDMVLLQRPWEVGEDGNDWNYIWMCYRADYDESRAWPSAPAEGQAQFLDGRLSSLKTDNSARFKLMHQDLQDLRSKIGADVQELTGKVDQVGARMESLDHRLDHVLELVRLELLPVVQHTASSARPCTSPVATVLPGCQAEAAASACMTAAPPPLPKESPPLSGQRFDIEPPPVLRVSSKGKPDPEHTPAQLEPATPVSVSLPAKAAAQVTAAETSEPKETQPSNEAGRQTGQTNSQQMPPPSPAEPAQTDTESAAPVAVQPAADDAWWGSVAASWPGVGQVASIPADQVVDLGQIGALPPVPTLTAPPSLAGAAQTWPTPGKKQELVPLLE